MDVIIGIKCADFVIIAADMTTSLSIMILKTNEDKLFKMSEKLVMAASGQRGDVTQFAEYVSKVTQLHKMRNGYELSPNGVASFTRESIAESLRTVNSFRVDLMMAGYDEHEGPKLFFIDYLATMAQLKYATHGFGGLFSVSILDRYYSDNMSREAAYELLKKCVLEIHQRLIVNLGNFKVQIVDKNGIHDLPPITAKDLVTETNNCFPL